MVASHLCMSASDCTFCNKVINPRAQSFKCRVGGRKLKREQLKGRCKLRISPWKKSTDRQVAQMLGVCEFTASEEIWD